MFAELQRRRRRSSPTTATRSCASLATRILVELDRPADLFRSPAISLRYLRKKDGNSLEIAERANAKFDKKLAWRRKRGSAAASKTRRTLQRRSGQGAASVRGEKAQRLGQERRASASDTGALSGRLVVDVRRVNLLRSGS